MMYFVFKVPVQSCLVFKSLCKVVYAYTTWILTNKQTRICNSCTGWCGPKTARNCKVCASNIELRIFVTVFIINFEALYSVGCP